MNKENLSNFEIEEEINNIVSKRKSHKKTIIIGIITGSILIALAILIIGYIKFNWFQKEEIKEEINDLNIEINSVQNQIQYFTNNKEIKTITVTNEYYKNETIQNIDTNFMISIIEKKDQENKAVLII